MKRWINKTAVVTGAGAGIGAAISTGLANAGIRVVGLELQQHLIDELQSKYKDTICYRRCDITKLEEVSEVFKWIDERFGGTHILVNNAGVGHQGHITDVGTKTLSDDKIISSIDTNVKATILCTRHAVSSMKRSNFHGHIININSVTGHYIPRFSSMSVYASTKHWMTAFTAGLTSEMAHFNINIKTTSISPGLVNTNMTKFLDKMELPSLQPRDLADAVLYILSTPPHINISELTITSAMEKRV